MMDFTHDELDLLRQWYNAVLDCAPDYLVEPDDHLLAFKILTALGPGFTAAARQAEKAAQE